MPDRRERERGSRAEREGGGRDGEDQDASHA
jgi:hypothetical protein